MTPVERETPSLRGVVTGGTGFLGSHVADHLAESGHEVMVLDAVESVRYRTAVVDLLDLAGVTAALRGADFVCHLGAVGDVYLAMEKPYLAGSVNVTGTANVCEAARVVGVGRVVLASTWEVYGRPSYQPMDEDHPCTPDHPYNITKLAGERLGLAYAHFKSVPVLALRLGTAFGTRMRPNSVFSIFARKAFSGEAITIQGTGAQGRQFTHVRDIATAFEAALTRGDAGGVYNVVGDEMVSFKQLAEVVVAIAPTKISFGEARTGDVPTALVSNHRAKRELGWTPRVPFRAGVEEIVEENRILSAARS